MSHQKVPDVRCITGAWEFINIMLDERSKNVCGKNLTKRMILELDAFWLVMVEHMVSLGASPAWGEIHVDFIVRPIPGAKGAQKISLAMQPTTDLSETLIEALAELGGQLATEDEQQLLEDGRAALRAQASGVKA